MAMNRVPTLVVGIGGIGSQITSEISRLLGPEDRKYVGLVCLDTNVSDLNRLKEFDVKSIQISDDRLVKDFLKDIKWLNMLKVRYSHGRVGNDKTGDRFPYLRSVPFPGWLP